ncbi:MAG: DUF3267 domain-containing protein [Chloroflexi bacterium]|nr:DUF3267 domain-containing protein [Chloroflexota bacterium]MYE47282.1 DUF3267 domain-containing protein [Chloroflexota bacterium]
MAASLPEGYEEIGRWDLGQVRRRVILLLVVLSLVAMVVTANVAIAITYLASGVSSISLDLGSLALGLVGGLALHEAAHAVAFLALGARPRFGAKWGTRFGPVLYASAPGSYLGRTGYVVVGLAPAVGLTVVLLAVIALAPAGGLIGSAAFLAVILNVGGSAGDAMMMRTVLTYPADARFEDTADGFTVYGPAPAG